ncbi:hypothetical protein [Amycolatopsis sp. NPDC003676]
MPNTPANDGPAVSRVLRRSGNDTVLSLLAHELSGTDLTALLTEALRVRSGRVTASRVLRDYQERGFSTDDRMPLPALRAAEDLLFGKLPQDFEVLSLAPILPFGAHSAVTSIGQSRVVATSRASEVSADPTVGLALAAAARRTGTRDENVVRLAASQRVARVIRVDGGRAITIHFQLFGMISAGRRGSGSRFGHEQICAHLLFVVAVLRAAGARAITIRLDPPAAGARVLAERVSARVSGAPDLAVVIGDARPQGREPYYTGLSYKVFTGFGDEKMEVADGGLVDWTAKLLSDRREQTLVTGCGLERVAMVQQGG